MTKDTEIIKGYLEFCKSRGADPAPMLYSIGGLLIKEGSLRVVTLAPGGAEMIARGVYLMAVAAAHKDEASE